MKIENVAVISLEDYAEYQELKKRKSEIDYNRLNTGSIVRLKRTGSHCVGADNVDFDKPFNMVFKDSKFYIFDHYKVNKFKKSTRNDDVKYNTFIQEGKFIHFTNYNTDYITEVISY